MEIRGRVFTKDELIDMKNNGLRVLREVIPMNNNIKNIELNNNLSEARKKLLKLSTKIIEMISYINDIIDNHFINNMMNNEDKLIDIIGSAKILVAYKITSGMIKEYGSLVREL